MKCDGKIFSSLFLISIFSAGTIVRAQNININLKIAENAMRFLRPILEAFDEGGSRFSLREKALYDGTLQSEAVNLGFRVRITFKTFDKLIDTYKELILGIIYSCSYNKEAYNNLTKLDVNSTIEDKVSHLSNVINATSLNAARVQELIGNAYEKITNISATLALMQKDLRLLEKVEKSQIILKFIEDSKVYVDWLEKASSEFRDELKADQEFTGRLKGTADAQTAVLVSVENVSSRDQLNQSEIIRHSEKITSALREISDFCVEAKSD